MRMKLVSVRLKPSENLEKVMITGSMDAVIFLKKRLGGDIRGNAMYALNLNTNGRVESIDVCSYETFRKNINIMLAGSILSNASHTILLSRERSQEKDKLIGNYIKNSSLLGIPCIDHICFEKKGMDLDASFSYRANELVDFTSKMPESISASIDPISLKSVNSEVIRLKLHTDKYFSAEKDMTKEDAIESIAKELMYMDREYCTVLSMANGRPLNATHVAVGGLASSGFTMREIFKVPLLSGADSVIFIHNHPSGNTAPSKADINTTMRVQNVARLFGMELDDSLIVGAENSKIYSMRENGNLDDTRREQVIKAALSSSLEETPNLYIGGTKVMKCVVNGRLASPAKVELIAMNTGDRVKVANFTIFTPDPRGPEKEVLDEKTGEVKTYNQGVALNCRAWGENADYIEKLNKGAAITGAATVRYGKQAPMFVITKLDMTNEIHKQMSALVTAYTSGEIDKIYDMGDKIPTFQKDNSKDLNIEATKEKGHQKEDNKEYVGAPDDIKEKMEAWKEQK